MRAIIERQSPRGFKKPYERAVKKSVSLPEFLFDRGCDRARGMQLYGFSDYIQELIRRDIQNATNP